MTSTNIHMAHTNVSLRVSHSDDSQPAREFEGQEKRFHPPSVNGANKAKASCVPVKNGSEQEFFDPLLFPSLRRFP
jgi:hypothetical protein